MNMTSAYRAIITVWHYMLCHCDLIFDSILRIKYNPTAERKIDGKTQVESFIETELWCFCSSFFNLIKTVLKPFLSAELWTKCIVYTSMSHSFFSTFWLKANSTVSYSKMFKRRDITQQSIRIDLLNKPSLAQKKYVEKVRCMELRPIYRYGRTCHILSKILRGWKFGT